MWHVLRLSVLRMWRTRATMICQVLALFAMMTPLLIILGLKYGIVQSMKQQILKDPSALEVRMTDAVRVSEDLLQKIRSWPETRFVTPCVGSLYSTVNVSRIGDGESEEMTAEMIPTAPGDPLLQNTDLCEPERGQVVLSEKLAARLHVQAEEEVRIRVWRNMRQEVFELTLRVVGVLPRQHLAGMALLLPLEGTIEVEDFVIQGKGVPGSVATIMDELYSGVALAPGEDASLAEFMCAQYPGLAFVKIGDDSSYPGAPKDGWLLRVEGKRMDSVQVDALVEMAEEHECFAWPWVEPLSAELRLPGGERREVQVVCSGGQTSSASVCAPPLICRMAQGLDSDFAELCVPSPQGESRVSCRVQVDETMPDGVVQVSPQVLAILHRGVERSLVWDYRVDGLRYPVLSFNSLRVYACSMEVTESLNKRLLAEGVHCTARLAIIHRLLALESSLAKLFIVITVGAALGAIVSFAMSLFNAAELHRRDYALVQLLGAGRGMLALMPLMDALASTALALLLSFACFYATSTVIGHLFAESASGDALCRLSAHHIQVFCASCAGIACISSVAAAIKVLCISPAEILREL